VKYSPEHQAHEVTTAASGSNAGESITQSLGAQSTSQEVLAAQLDFIKQHRDGMLNSWIQYAA
jgi:hypothetical protein